MLHAANAAALRLRFGVHEHISYYSLPRSNGWPNALV